MPSAHFMHAFFNAISDTKMANGLLGNQAKEITEVNGVQTFYPEFVAKKKNNDKWSSHAQ